MKKTVVFMSIMLALMILSTGTVFAAENGFEAKASEKNPAFEERSMNGMVGMMVVNENNDNLHFSSMGHIMIPGNGTENEKSSFKTMVMDNVMEMTHLEPPGWVKQFKDEME